MTMYGGVIHGYKLQCNNGCGTQLRGSFGDGRAKGLRAKAKKLGWQRTDVSPRGRNRRHAQDWCPECWAKREVVGAVAKRALTEAQKKRVDDFVAELFTNGQGERGSNLVIMRNGRDLGGWAELVIHEKVAEFLISEVDRVIDGGGK
jgi:hypothetical protein